MIKIIDYDLTKKKFFGLYGVKLYYKNQVYLKTNQTTLNKNKYCLKIILFINIFKILIRFIIHLTTPGAFYNLLP